MDKEDLFQLLQVAEMFIRFFLLFFLKSFLDLFLNSALTVSHSNAIISVRIFNIHVACSYPQTIIPGSLNYFNGNLKARCQTKKY